MKAAFVLALVAALIAVVAALDAANIQFYANMVNEINNKNVGWTAELSQEVLTKDFVAIKNMMGDLSVGSESELPRKTYGWATKTQDLPTNFKVADKWPECAQVMNTVHDQSACGSCWAVSAGAALTERYCIANGGKNIFLSSRDILSCCTSCGYGCNGGWPSSAMSYAVKTGIPTGSPDSTDNSLCVRYPFLTCKHHTEGTPQCSDYDFDTPKCQKSCDADTTYSTPYEQDKVKFSSAYNPYGEAAMMKDLYENGPMTVSYTVYQDFMTYRSGIYRHTSGSSLGGHAVVLVGWGEENGTKYWLIKNNWNSAWGENGYFRIVRGTNECGIEGGAAAAKY